MNPGVTMTRPLPILSMDGSACTACASCAMRGENDRFCLHRTDALRACGGIADDSRCRPAEVREASRSRAADEPRRRAEGLLWLVTNDPSLGRAADPEVRFRAEDPRRDS